MQEYWDALERLKAGCPSRVPLGSSINKDTVALEAGRKRGAIKKSRISFGKLICSGQLKLATVLEFSQYNRSDSLGVKPPLY